MTDVKFVELCKETVRNYFEARNGAVITTDNVFIVWYCKTLQNWKALASTNTNDGMYYELTYNGDKKELYLDAYKKLENLCLEV